MFEHLPIITDENYDVLVEKELNAMFDKFDCIGQGVTDLREVTEYGCREFKEHNPNLVDVVYSCANTVAESLEEMGATPRAANLAGILCLTNILPLLRVIDRSLEAQELERRFML
jgi:hypothetical protein